MAVIQEAWISGVSTRRVDELVQAMGLSGISKSTVSKLCKDIDERVGEFLNRPLTGEWPYLWLDATYLKVRQGGRIVPVAAIIAVAANTEGRREIIGLGIGPSEAETFWTEFLRSLRVRGLGASDWSSATRIQASKPPSPGSSKQPGNAVASTGCATPWPMSRVVSILSSPLPSGRPSINPTAPMPAKPGARSQSNCARAGQNWLISWMPASTTCWPTCHSRASIAPNCTARTRLNV